MLYSEKFHSIEKNKFCHEPQFSDCTLWNIFDKIISLNSFRMCAVRYDGARFDLRKYFTQKQSPHFKLHVHCTYTWFDVCDLELPKCEASSLTSRRDVCVWMVNEVNVVDRVIKSNGYYLSHIRFRFRALSLIKQNVNAFAFMQRVGCRLRWCCTWCRNDINEIKQNPTQHTMRLNPEWHFDIEYIYGLPFYHNERWTVWIVICLWVVSHV